MGGEFANPNQNGINQTGFHHHSHFSVLPVTRSCRAECPKIPLQA